MHKSLPKNIRLKSQKDISTIFLKGKSVFLYPIKLGYCIHQTHNQPNFIFGVSVSKRNFSKAVDRNRIKRLLREAIRINKAEIEQDFILKNIRLKCMFVFVGKEIPEFALLQQKIILTLQQLKTINEPSS